MANQKVQFRISMDEMEIFERTAMLSNDGTDATELGWIPGRLEASHMTNAELVDCVAGVDLC